MCLFLITIAFIALLKLVVMYLTLNALEQQRKLIDEMQVVNREMLLHLRHIESKISLIERNVASTLTAIYSRLPESGRKSPHQD